MNQPIHDNLETILTQIFEEWAMMFSDGPISEIPPGTALEHVGIHFDGEEHGDIDFWLSKPLIESLVVNVLGLNGPEEITPSDKDDVIRELANVVCGHFVSSQFGSEKIFQLSIPEVNLKTLPPENTDESAKLSIDGNPIFAQINVGG